LAKEFGYDPGNRTEISVKENRLNALSSGNHPIREQRRLRQAFRERPINQQEIK
jgi:hypothetical protein